MADSFLQSMTFSLGGQFLDTCDCEECEGCENMPLSIREFIKERKDQRKATGPIKRTQQRSLIGRDGQISIWCMHMPKNADPLVEFGSNHRIVWVKQLATSSNTSNNNGSTLRWIGKGIIGSRDEETSRKKMIEWNEGDFFLVPSNGGKAIGWIHTSDDSNSTNADTNDDDATGTTQTKEIRSESDGFAVLHVAKIPLGIIDREQQKSRESNNQWSNQLIENCRNGLECCKIQPDKNPSYYKFSRETSKLLKEVFCEAEGVATKYDVIERATKRIRLHREIT